MAILSGSRFGLRMVKEVTFGTVPSTSFSTVRLTDTDLNLKFDTLRSNEIRSDRQIASFRHGMKSIEGSIGVELAVGAHNDLWSGALAAAWTGTTGAYVLKTGTTLNTYSFERAFSDGPQFDVFMGCAVNGVDISITPDKMATAKFSVIGQNSAAMQGTTYAAGGVIAAGTAQPCDAFTGSLTEGGSPVAVVTAINIKLANGRKTEGVVGSRVTPAIFEGTCDVTGTVTALFESATLYNKFVNETESAIVVNLTDGSTGTMSFTLPKVKYGTGDFNIPKEGPITVKMDFQALYDTGTSSTLTINSNHA